MVKSGSMTVSAAKDPKQAIGHAPEDLNLQERKALTGKMIALEIYSPETLPLRRIEADRRFGGGVRHSIDGSRVGIRGILNSAVWDRLLR